MMEISVGMGKGFLVNEWLGCTLNVLWIATSEVLAERVTVDDDMRSYVMNF